MSLPNLTVPRCPRCGLPRAVIRLADLYATAGVYTPIREHLLVGAPYTPTQRAQVRVFVRYIRPPAAPAAYVPVLFALGALSLAVLALVAFLLRRAVLPRPALWATVDELAYAVLAGVLSVSLFFLLAAVYEERYGPARYRRERARWEGIYYCADDRLAFDPGTASPVPVERVQELVCDPPPVTVARRLSGTAVRLANRLADGLTRD